MRGRLTDAMVRALRAEGTTKGGRPASLEVRDVGLPGFGVRVSPSGHKSFSLVYRRRQDGKLRRMALGPYPLVSLGDARARARELLASVVQGEDPADARRTDREAPTFGDLVTAYLERHAKPHKRSWCEDERILHRYVPAEWHSRKAADISRADVRAVIAALVTTDRPIMANRTFATLRAVFNFGLREDMIETSPCLGLRRPAPEPQRDRVLTRSELRALWLALDAEPDPLNAGLFRLYLLTAQRGYELRTMRWQDVDAASASWTIPRERAKNKLAHRVPLSSQALAVLDGLRAGRVDDCEWVFPTRRASASGYRESLVKATGRIRERSGVDFHPHDLRRTVATFLTSELGVSRLVVSKILNHVEPGVTKVYDRASYDREKRGALEAWAVHLEAIVRGETGPAKVVPLRA